MLRSILATAAAVTCAGLVSSSLHAQTWNQAGGTHNWSDPANWTPNEVPNGVGVVANVTNGLTETQVINLPTIDDPLPEPHPGTLILGTLNIGNPDFTWDGTQLARYQLIGNRPIRFDNGTEPARINAVANVPALDVVFNQHDILETGFGIFLDSDLIIDATHPEGAVNPDMLRIRATIVDGMNGPKGITKTGDGWVEMWPFGNNTYSGLTQVMGGRLRIGAGSGTTVIPGDVEISGGAHLQMSFGFSEHIADTAIVRFVGNGNFNPGGGSETIGGLEAVGEATHTALVGGGGGTITFGGNNLDATFEGRFSSNTSIAKVGTGVQTLGGTLASLTTADSSPETNAFNALEGRVDLAKSDGAASIAHRNLVIGDGTAFGEQMPEVRLLANEQINVTVDAEAPEETTHVQLHAGILNINGFTETVGTLRSLSSGTVELGAGGNLIAANSLAVDHFAMLEVTSGNGGQVTVGNLDMADGENRWLDLTNSTMTVQDGDLSEINALVKRGHAGGAWTGDGISSSAAAAQSGRALGVGPVNGDVKVMFTWAGDATLDGVVNISDLSILAGNWQQTDRLWHQGDFNYDGTVNISDLSLLAGNWQAGAAGMSFEEALAMFDVFNGVVVPEPASIGLLAMAGLGLLGRRQRRGA